MPPLRDRVSRGFGAPWRTRRLLFEWKRRSLIEPAAYSLLERVGETDPELEAFIAT
jgi:hypothetical protein